MSARARVEQRITQHRPPPHRARARGRATEHYAKSAKAAIDAGKLDEKAFDCLDWA